jgi:hypothetical protein
MFYLVTDRVVAFAVNALTWGASQGPRRTRIVAVL